ncbi:hypothetical protein [Neobacillus drentensis]|uniref:hypothetical protein n=1 Tax=Neobacillus drentensis TaxID=220684 RepID=UPI003000D0C9
MKSWSKALLGTAMAGLLVAGAGYGTYSWYTAEKTASGTIDNGTFGLADMGQLFQHQKFAPSQQLTSEWQTIQNTGNLDQLLKATFTQTIDSPNANINKYKVGYIALKFKTKPNQDVLKAVKFKMGALLNGGTVNPIDQTDMTASGAVEVTQGVLSDVPVQSGVNAQSKSKANKMSKTFTLGDGTKFWSLKEGEYIAISFGVLLSDSAGNEFQGVHYNANFKVEAKQTDPGAQYQSDLDTTN